MKFDLNLWMGIVGLIASLIFGFLSIYQYKSRRYPGKLTFYNELTIGLFDSLVKHFPQIAIKYENKNIDEQIILLKAFIINTGKIDIKDSLVQEKLNLRLPLGYSWLSVKITDISEGANAVVEIIGNVMYFDLGLFKKYEYIRFEALLQIPLKDDSVEDHKSKEIFAFNHRIADTGKIEKRKGSLTLPKFFTPVNVAYSVLAVTLVFCFSYFLSRIPASSVERFQFQYHIKSDTNNSIIHAYPKTSEIISIYSLKDIEVQDMPQNEFFNKLVKITVGKSDTSINPRQTLILFISILIVVMLLAVSALANSYREYRKVKKIRAILNLDEKGKDYKK